MWLVINFHCKEESIKFVIVIVIVIVKIDQDITSQGFDGNSFEGGDA